MEVILSCDKKKKKKGGKKILDTVYAKPYTHLVEFKCNCRYSPQKLGRWYSPKKRLNHGLKTLNESVSCLWVRLKAGVRVHRFLVWDDIPLH